VQIYTFLANPNYLCSFSLSFLFMPKESFGGYQDAVAIERQEKPLREVSHFGKGQLIQLVPGTACVAVFPSSILSRL
jgi:hypothetical protein